MPNRKNILLYPLSLLYGLITAFRNVLYDWKILPSHEFSFPVICVGNITVGGTGKTPHTEYLAALLSKKFNIAVLSRGYKRKSKGFISASSSSQVSDIGDEPLQIFRKFPEIKVAVDIDRVNGIKRIVTDNPDTQVIILDDGFQHRRVTPGLSILLTDFERLLIRDHMLPYGYLREYKSNMKRADIIIVTKTPEDFSPVQRRLIIKEINKAPYQNLYFTSTVYKDPIPVFGGPCPSASLAGSILRQGNGILLVTGIANPGPLKKYIGSFGPEIIHLAFPDHHNYSPDDLIMISSAFNRLTASEKYIITTEKDSVRIPETADIENYIRDAFYYIPVGIDFFNDDREHFDKLITDYVRKNKRNNRISEI
jgi:tetraacyldisaccharide 4'-kinase